MLYADLIGKNNGVRQRLYKKILSHFFGVMWRMIIDGHMIVLPHKLGSIRLAVRNTPLGNIDKLRIDFNESRKMWKERPDLYGKQFVYHTNEHTGGKYIRLFHSHKNVLNRNTQIYKIHACEAQKKLYSTAFKNGKQY
jgi:hypothetical protein